MNAVPVTARQAMQPAARQKPSRSRRLLRGILRLFEPMGQARAAGELQRLARCHAGADPHLAHRLRAVSQQLQPARKRPAA